MKGGFPGERALLPLVSWALPQFTSVHSFSEMNECYNQLAYKR